MIGDGGSYGPRELVLRKHRGSSESQNQHVPYQKTPSEEEEEQTANGSRVVIGSKTRRGRGASEKCWECGNMVGLGKEGASACLTWSR